MTPWYVFLAETYVASCWMPEKLKQYRLLSSMLLSAH